MTLQLYEILPSAFLRKHFLAASHHSWSQVTQVSVAWRPTAILQFVAEYKLPAGDRNPREPGVSRTLTRSSCLQEPPSSVWTATLTPPPAYTLCASWRRVWKARGWKPTWWASPWPTILPTAANRALLISPSSPLVRQTFFYKLSQSLCLRNPGWICRAREFLSWREMAVLSSLAPPSCPSSQNSHPIRQGRTNRTTKRNNNREFESESSDTCLTADEKDVLWGGGLWGALSLRCVTSSNSQ